MRIELVGNRIEVHASPRASDQIRGIPGSRYDKDLRVWTVPLTLGACYALRATFGDTLESGPQIIAWAQERHAQTEQILAVKDGSMTMPGIEKMKHLRNYQVPAAAWMALTGRTLLADEMRTGKTVMSLAAVDLLESWGAEVFPLLIVAPNSMKFVWRAEIEKFSPGHTVQVIHGTAAKRKKQFESGADIFIINWESLYLHTRLSPYGSVELTDKEKKEKEINKLAPRTVIFDEAHKIVLPKNKVTRAAWHVAHKATYRFGLTGTPMVNNPEDLWSVMHTIAPEEWPVKTKYIERYTISALNAYNGLDVFGLNPGTQKELYRILDPRFMRRTLREVRPEIPDTLPPQIRWVEMGPKQAKAYDQMMNHMMVETENGLIIADTPLIKGGRLVQAASATLSLTPDGQVVLEEPSCKIDALMEIIEEAPDEPLVVFSASRKLINLACARIAKHKLSFGEIVGGQDAELRAATVAAFQAGQLQYVFCTTGAGSEGITLNRADRLVFLSKDWSSVKNRQASARIEGEGLAQVIEIQTLGTIEQAVTAANDIKEGLLEEIVRDYLRPGAKR